MTFTSDPDQYDTPTQDYNTTTQEDAFTCPEVYMTPSVPIDMPSPDVHVTSVDDAYTNDAYLATPPLDDRTSGTDNAFGYPTPTSGHEGPAVPSDAPCEQPADSLNPVEELMQHLLVPLWETGHVTSFKVEEVSPSQYPCITSNIVSCADESFLHTSQNSLGPGQVDRLAGTMQNLHERQSFLNLTSDGLGKAMRAALAHLKDDQIWGSMAVLNNTGFKDCERNTLVDDPKPLHVIASGRHVKNLLVICFVIVLNLIALGSCRNLQSSMNHEASVGVISLAVSFVGYTLGSVFSPSVVANIPPKRVLVCALVPHLVYVAANMYPALWIMAPVSLLQGVSFAIAWNAMSTYVTLLSKGHATKHHDDYAAVNARFFGIFGFVYQTYFLVGNLIASLVLSYASHSEDGDLPSAAVNSSLIGLSDTSSPLHLDKGALSYNVQTDNVLNNLMNGSLVAETVSLAGGLNGSLSAVGTLLAGNGSESWLHLCGANFWQHYDLGGGVYAVSNETKFVLFGTYMGCVVLAMMLAIFGLENLNPRLFESDVPTKTRIAQQIGGVFRFITGRRYLLLFPLLTFSFAQVGFVTSEMTKAFVTCPLGMHMVGYIMMFLGVSGSFASYLTGVLARWTGRVPLLMAAAGINVGVCVVMDTWQPTEDSVLPYFAIMGLWGMADGIYVSQTNSLMSVVFPETFEDAFAGLRIAQGVGASFVFATSPSLGMRSKIYMQGIWCIVGVITYVYVEWKLKQERNHKPVELRQTSLPRQTSV